MQRSFHVAFAFHELLLVSLVAVGCLRIGTICRHSSEGDWRTYECCTDLQDGDFLQVKIPGCTSLVFESHIIQDEI
jgi:hypothetical protein